MANYRVRIPFVEDRHHQLKIMDQLQVQSRFLPTHKVGNVEFFNNFDWK